MFSDFSISDYNPALSDGPANDITYGFTDANICGRSRSSYVYRIRHDGLRLAVKRLKAEYRSNPLYVEAFRKEFIIGRQLKHDALPLYRDFHEGMDDVYIVMDYVDGIGLDEFTDTEAGRRYFGSADNVRRFLDNLLDATAYFHRSGVIHCDLKPANIMLRHSDMKVMLIDLDKAYTDTLDLTSGGTKNISAPPLPGEKPTAQKDFAAIGMIIDFIAANVSDFPKSSCARFRKECESGMTDADRLKKALEPRHILRNGLIPAAIAIPVTTLLLLGYFSMQRTKELREPQPVSYPSSIASPREGIDTCTTTSMVHTGRDNSPGSTGSNGNTDIPIPSDNNSGNNNPGLLINPADIDRRFRQVTGAIESGYGTLRTGSMTTRAITDMMQEIGAAYQAEDANVRKAYRSQYPQISDLDLANALITAYDKSGITRTYMAFMQECGDSVDVRLAAGIY